MKYGQLKKGGKCHSADKLRIMLLHTITLARVKFLMSNFKYPLSEYTQRKIFQNILFPEEAIGPE